MNKGWKKKKIYLAPDSTRFGYQATIRQCRYHRRPVKPQSATQQERC
jgi:hypothetical protein